MKIGIIGIGVVGKAVKYGMEKLGHKVTFYDPAYPKSKWEDILDTAINFLCVPTPSLEDGSCDTSIVEQTVLSLVQSEYTGIIVIKSTVTPGTTKRLSEDFTRGFGKVPRGIVFVPEFLRERCAEIDFVENHDICIIGTYDEYCYKLIKDAHGRFPKKFIQLTSTEAEFCKYFNNVYNATLVTFANSMYEVCK
jgi:UDPglucose 6-dehydrogenase